MPQYRGAKIKTQQVGGKWYATGMGQAATGSTEAEAYSNLLPLLREAQKHQRERERNAPPPRKPKHYRVKLATGDTYEIEAYSLKEARDEANRRLYYDRKRQGRL